MLINSFQISIEYSLQYIPRREGNKENMASLRRSSVKLTNLGRGNVDLKMVITQLKTVKENASSYTKAQEKSMEDVEKWALKEENRAIQDCSQKMKEIFELWTDAQHQFVECVEELRHNFKMILEGNVYNMIRNRKPLFEQI